MARKPRVLIAGGIYHVTCRGNERRAIFRDDEDRARFLKRLGASADLHGVRVLLYCLMGNHVHLLLQTPAGNLDRFMGSLLTGYTVYFNRRHRRAGHLMQGRYGAQVVEGNEYLLKLSRYIHLNPVHVREVKGLPLAERMRLLRAYRWSSYRDYVGARSGSEWLQMGPVLGQMEWARKGAERAAYRRYVEAGLAETDEEFVELMRDRGVAIGAEAFVEEVKSLHRGRAQAELRREDVVFRRLASARSVDEVERAVARAAGSAWETRRLRKKGRSVRSVWAWALQKYACCTQRDAAQRLGLRTGAAVSRMAQRLEHDETGTRWRRSVELFFKG